MTAYARITAIVTSALISGSCGADGSSDASDAAVLDGSTAVDASGSNDAAPGECSGPRDCTICEYIIAPVSTAECECIVCPTVALTKSECTANRDAYNTWCDAASWPEAINCPIFDCLSVEPATCTAESTCRRMDCAADAPTSIAAAPSGLPSQVWAEGAGLVIDLEACTPGRWFAALSLGSAWVSVQPNATQCEIWLGGETENPLYDGSPTQQCRFQRGATCELRIDAPGLGGPAIAVSPGCLPTGQ